MLSTLVAIFGVIVLFGGLLIFLWYAIPTIIDVFNQIYDYFIALLTAFPTWLLPFILIVVAVAVISLIIKCI